MTRITRIAWLCVLFFLPMVLGAFAAEILTNDAVVTMVKAGLGDDVIISKIKTSQNQFDLSTQALVRLKEDGVSPGVIKAMVETAAPVAPKASDAAAKETEDAVALYRQGKAVEAEAAFDKLLSERPTDADLKVWKALAILEQARAKKDADAAPSAYKPLVNKAYAILQPLGRERATNADWNFAMAKAFWMNERPTWAGKAARTPLKLRADFVEAQILLGDLAYDSDVEALRSPSRSPQAETAGVWAGTEARREYEKALALPGISAALQAEALYKLGRVAADLGKNPGTARGYWERAAAADPDCRYGVLAKQGLEGASKK
jgi:tetratricopeptide (TPR) repeat protein